MKALLLALALSARAGDLVRVDFVAGGRLQNPPAVGAWSPALNSLFNAPVPTAGWGKPLNELKTLDWRDPRHGGAFAPFVAELAKQGLTPEQFAKAPAHQRAQAAQAAAVAVAQAYAAQVDASALLAEAALQKGAQPALDAAVALLQAQAEAGLYLDDARKLKVESVRRRAQALQTEARAKKALALLEKDADALRSDDPVAAVLARDPSEEFSTGSPAKLIKYDASKRKAKPAPQIDLKPGQNSKMVLAGLMFGLSVEDASKLGFSSKARDDLFTRYPAALDEAEAEAVAAALEEEDVYFGEARMSVAGKSESWSFDFYAIGEEGPKAARKISVVFSKDGKAAGSAPLAPAPVPAGTSPLRIKSSSLGMGVKFSPFDALRFAGDGIKDVEVGLSISMRPVAEPISNDTDLWYVISRAGEEVGRVNARTGELRGPPAPAPEKTATWWDGVKAWLASWLT